MYPQDIEILSLIQTSELALLTHRLTDNDLSDAQFLKRYCTEKLKTNEISPSAVGRFTQDLVLKNPNSFLKSYKVVKKRVLDIACIRYSASVEKHQIRFDALIRQLKKSHLHIELNVGSDNTVKAGIGVSKYGLVCVREDDMLKLNSVEPGTRISFQFLVHSPAIYHVIKECLYSYGFIAASFPKYDKDHVQTVETVIDETDEKQKVAISLGEIELDKRAQDKTPC